MDLLEEHGVGEVLVNLHFLPDPVRRFAEEYRGPVAIRTVMEPELLGSGGTLHANRDFVAGDEQFYILYADNLTTADLGALARFNREHPAPLTVGLFHTEHPQACGIAELAPEGTIIDFDEKPAEPNIRSGCGRHLRGTPGAVRLYQTGSHAVRLRRRCDAVARR